jgi:hypothetical protein
MVIAKSEAKAIAARLLEEHPSTALELALEVVRLLAEAKAANH